MRFVLKKIVRIAIIGVLVLSVCIICFTLFTEFNPQYEEKTITLYKYNHTPDVGYSVLLKPNIVYEEDILEEGQVYITEYVDSIQSHFNYEYSSDKESSISADYMVYAQVEGYAKGTVPEKKIIFVKKYILLPKTSLNEDNSALSINESITLNLDEYNDFVEQVITTSKIQCDIEMSIVMDIEIHTDIGNNINEEIFTPSISFPLNTNYFEIVKAHLDNKEEKIDTIEQILLPKNKTKIIILFIALALLLSLLVYTIFFVSNKMEKPYIKTIKNILKKYGSRIVALNDIEIPHCETYVNVKSMADLVKFSDEVEKPIMYNHSQYLEDIRLFFVIDNNTMYRYNVLTHDMIKYENFTF